MSQFEDFDENEGDEDNGPKALRSALKKAQTELKALREENQTFKTESRKNTVAAVLKSKGLPPKLAALYTGEPDEASVEAWAAEYSDVFGSGTPAAEDSGEADDETKAQYAAMNKAQSTGSAPVEGHAALAKQLDEVGSLDDLVKLLAADSKGPRGIR